MGSNGTKTRTEEMAEAMGVLVGAASDCDWATDERLNEAVAKIETFIATAAVDDSDAEKAKQHFYAGVEAGKAAIEDGRADPKAVEVVFGELEEKLP
jgi:predicted transcriptional regulator